VQITHMGRTGSVRWWSRETRIPESTIRSRLAAGWSVARALTVPVEQRFSRLRKAEPVRRRPVPRMIHRRRDDTAVLDYVVLGQRHFVRLGRWGSPEAVQRYAQFCADWIAGKTGQRPVISSNSASVAELIESFLLWAVAEYRKGERQTSEIHCCRSALRVLNRDYGTLPAADFGPDQLAELLKTWVAEGFSLSTIKGHRSRVIRVFRRGLASGLISAEQVARLAAVPTVKPGRTSARGPAKKSPVPEADFRRTLEHLPPAIRQAVECQRLIGCRPAEICSIRPCDIDRSGTPWRWTIPESVAKTAHLDRVTLHHIGPRCQAILWPLLAAASPEDYLFRCRPGVNRPMDRSHYCRRIARAAKAAGVTPWTPHQLRHTRATAAASAIVRAAAAAIGDTASVTLRHYLSEDQIASQIAQEQG
jgi:integrase